MSSSPGEVEIQKIVVAGRTSCDITLPDMFSALAELAKIFRITRTTIGMSGATLNMLAEQSGSPVECGVRINTSTKPPYIEITCSGSNYNEIMDVVNGIAKIICYPPESGGTVKVAGTEPPEKMVIENLKLA